MVATVNLAFTACLLYVFRQAGGLGSTGRERVLDL